MDKHRLKVLLFQAIQAKKAYLSAEAMLEYFITDNKGLLIHKKLKFEKFINMFIAQNLDINDEHMKYFIDGLGLDNNPQLIQQVNPMTFEEFSIKYTEAGKSGDITEAYAYYCADPASHFLHKE